MKYISRAIEKKLDDYLKTFPVTAITGPRQSGKSTLIRYHLGERYRYVTFDDPLLTDFFYSDPKGFLNQYNNHVVFDEVQKVPELFQYLKMEIDNDRQNYGKYVLTGSSQFNMIKHITESLAGRIGLLSLLPFQYSEIPEEQKEKQLVYGSYPELVTRDYFNSAEWFGSYISTYIERDVRSLFNIGNIISFRRLIQLLAARCSQELNMEQLAREIGVDAKTIHSWISVLQASYIIFLLPSYHRNLGKRIVKRSKIYFYDTGLVCYLTGTDSEEILNKGPLGGAVFENYVIAEMKKSILHYSLTDKLFYFRSNAGLEADLIIDSPRKQLLIYLEIKSTATPKFKMTDNLGKIMELETLPADKKGYLVHKGKDEGKFSESLEYINYRTLFDKYPGKE